MLIISQIVGKYCFEISPDQTGRLLASYIN